MVRTWCVVLAVGCGGTGVSTPTPSTSPPAPLPPKPRTVSEAVPADASEALQVDLANLRTAPTLARARGWLDLFPCLQRGNARAMLADADRIGFASWGPEQDFVGFIEQRASERQTSPTELLTTVLGVFGQTPAGRPEEVTEGRHRRAEAAGLTAVKLGGRLLAIGTSGRVRRLLQGYDDPGNAAKPGYWQQQPPSYRPDRGHLFNWTTPALSEPHASAFAQLAGGAVAKALLGAPFRLAVQAEPLETRLEAQLRYERDARSVVERVRGRLRGAALIFRLLGLPLDKRVKTTHKGATLHANLALSGNETKRLMKFAEPTIPGAAERTCRALVHMGLPR
ncbi:MAG: hypothetical protein OXU20_07105 [Myxococcales bacterium]|nr:hypothetical protein [Myxococcales bacterium]